MFKVGLKGYGSGGILTLPWAGKITHSLAASPPAQSLNGAVTGFVTGKIFLGLALAMMAALSVISQRRKSPFPSLFPVN